MPKESLLAKPSFTITLTDIDNISTVLKPGTPSGSVTPKATSNDEIATKNEKAAVFLDLAKRNNDMYLMKFAASEGYVNALFELAQHHEKQPESRFCFWSTSHTQFALCLYLTLLVQMQNPLETKNLSVAEKNKMIQMSKLFISAEAKSGNIFAKWADIFVNKQLPHILPEMISDNKTIHYIVKHHLLKTEKSISDYYINGITQALNKPNKALRALTKGKPLPLFLKKDDDNNQKQAQTSVARNVKPQR